MENLVAFKTATVRLRDIMPKRKSHSEDVKRIEKVRRVVQTYNSAHQPVSQYFKRITCSTDNMEEIFMICEAFYKAVNMQHHCCDSVSACWPSGQYIFLLNIFFLQIWNDHQFTEMVTETLCVVLSFDLSRLETIKYDPTLSLDDATKRIISQEIKLSYRYELLSKVLRRSEMLSRECLLTAFSLNPSWKNLMALKAFHEQCSSSKRYQSLDGLSSILAAQTMDHHDYDPQADPVQAILHADKLATKLAKGNLWNDLTAVINGPRIKTLRWSTIDNWPELLQSCQRLLADPKYKVSWIRQNVAASGTNLQQFRFARANHLVLTKRLLNQTIQKLSKNKLKNSRIQFLAVYYRDDFLGYVKA